RHARARVRVHPHDGARRAPRRLRQRRAQRQLRAAPPRGRLRSHDAGPLHARVRGFRAPAEEARCDRDGHRQAPPRPRLLRADDVLPADHRRGADDRADRDGVEGDAGSVLRRHDPDRPRGRDGSAARSGGAGDDAGAPARSDAGRAAAAALLDATVTQPAAPEPIAFPLLVTEPVDGASNMALDEALLLGRLSGASPPTLRLYAWAPPTISLGYGQPLDDRIDLDAAARMGIGLVRRPTGGSAILHEGPDLELTYSVVAAAGDFPGAAGLLATYRWLA